MADPIKIIYEIAKDYVVWHELKRDPEDVPKHDKSYLLYCVSERGEEYADFGRWKNGVFVDESHWPIRSAVRWAEIPSLLWQLYCERFFSTEKRFQTDEEYEAYATRAVHEPIPADAELVGRLAHDTPLGYVTAAIYYKDGKYYDSNYTKHYRLD